MANKASSADAAATSDGNGSLIYSYLSKMFAPPPLNAAAPCLLFERVELSEQLFKSGSIIVVHLRFSYYWWFIGVLNSSYSLCTK